jgi:hypothetical protein
LILAEKCRVATLVFKVTRLTSLFMWNPFIVVWYRSSGDTTRKEEGREGGKRKTLRRYIPTQCLALLHEFEVIEMKQTS